MSTCLTIHDQPLPYHTDVNDHLNVAAPADENTYFGFELELEASRTTLGATNSHLFAQAKSLFSRHPLFIVKHDGTCRGGEFVTLPLTLSAQQAFIAQFEIDASAPRNCGMHVHVSKAGIERDHAARMILFMYSTSMQRFIDVVARRKANRWCAREANMVGYTTTMGKYQALNFQKSRTIEFRCFASTTDRVVISSNVEFADAVVQYTRTSTDRASLVVPANFIAFVNARRSTYPALAQRFALRKFAAFRSSEDCTPVTVSTPSTPRISGGLRTRSHAPSHADVAARLDLSDYAFCAWYINECGGQLITARGQVRMGLSLSRHALYHRRIVAGR